VCHTGLERSPKETCILGAGLGVRPSRLKMDRNAARCQKRITLHPMPSTSSEIVQEFSSLPFPTSRATHD
jgi:hypothetical protein